MTRARLPALLPALLLTTLLAALPARAQVDCGAPITGGDARFAEDYARNITKPLMEHDAGQLGPLLWAYIAGQARAESLGNLQDADGGFVPKPNNNLWNVQTDPTRTCSHRTIVGCLEANRNTPYAASKGTARESQCWLEGGNAMQWVKVCFPSYPSLEAAADDYLTRRPNYTGALRKMAKANPGREAFFNALRAARWSDQAMKPAYQTDTLDAMDQVLRGLATLRAAEAKALADASKDIDAWCARQGAGDAGERAALDAKQDRLIASLGLIGKACAAPAGSAAPSANSAIETCRMQPAPPPPAPPPPPASAQKPAGKASGRGEPHYGLPGGQTLSTQRAGEFWLLDSPDGTRIQVRQVPWNRSRQVAAIGAVSARVGAHRVGVHADGRVSIDGKPLPWTGRFVQRPLGNDAVVGLWGSGERPSQVAVLWRNGRVLRVHLRSSWLDVETSWARGTDTAGDRGLIGHASSTVAGALIGRDGRRGSLADAKQADAFVASWRTTPGESLFDYLPGESHATFDLRAFPHAPATPGKDALDAARAACVQAGVAADRLAACAFDLAVTGSRAFLASHLPAAPAARAPVEQAPAHPTHAAILAPDIAHPVQTLPNGQRFELRIGPGQQHTYRIDAHRGDPPVFLNVISDLSCVGGGIDDAKPAYQLFDARGRAISKAVPTCSDLFTGDVEEGDYYLVVKGAAAGAPRVVSLEAWTH